MAGAVPDCIDQHAEHDRQAVSSCVTTQQVQLVKAIGSGTRADRILHAIERGIVD
jgi:hypothetical protein